MSHYTTLDWQITDRVLTLTLNRPAQLNAFTTEMAEELIDAYTRASDDDAVGAVVVTGAGRAFCAGMDLSVGGNVFGLSLCDEVARHLQLQHAAHGKHLFGFFYRGGGDKGAACGLQLDQLVLRELKQGLPHQRARDAKQVGELLLSQLGARQQAVLHNGTGQGFNNGVGGSGFHTGSFLGVMIARKTKTVYTCVNQSFKPFWKAPHGTEHTRSGHDAWRPCCRHGGVPVHHRGR